MSLFDDTDKEWVKSTAKPRIPPPILRGNIFKLGSAEVELSRKPNSSAHHQLDSKTSDSKRPDPRRPEVSSPNAVNKKNAHPSIDRIQSNRPYTQLSSPAFPTPDSSDFAPDASDIASTYPTYASSALQENSQELVCASPTYVREPSPPATWASPTYSYQSPPYVQPLLEFVDETAPPSPTYAPRSVYLAEATSPVESVDEPSSTPSADVEWFDSCRSQLPGNLDVLKQGLKVAKVELCDCVQDFKASPTADYDMLATRELATKIKVLTSVDSNLTPLPDIFTFQ